MNIRYTVGFAARNEEVNLPHSLGSLARDIETGDISGIETIVCLNGCTDDSRQAALETGKRYKSLGIRIVESAPGLIAAQRKIIESSRSQTDFVTFYDADVLIQPGTTKAFIEHMEGSLETVAASGTQQPLDTGKLMYRILNIEALHPELQLGERKYLLGRCFAIRKHAYGVPDGLAVDDMYLSRSIVHEHGKASLQQVREAKVAYIGPQTLRDYFLKVRRYKLELQQITDSYPELEYLVPYFKRGRNVEALKSFGMRDWALVMAHDAIKVICKRVARKGAADTWIPLASTKEDLSNAAA